MKHEQHHHHHHYHYHHHHYHQHHQCQQQEQHVHVWGTLLAFWQLFQSAQALYHITAERPISLLMQTCSHERKPLTDNTMLFFPEKVKFCTTLFTSKRKAHYEKDVKRTANLHTVVKISWRDVDSAQMCTLHYKGYNNEYRISPDLGYYAGCQKAISLYISQLAAGKTPTWNATNANCPLYRLPNTYKGYLACDFVRGRWYAMSYESWIRYELYHNKAYRQFWSNHSSIFLVKPDYLLQRNGTEIDWLASLLTFRIRLLGCGEAEYLVNVDTEWNKPLWMLMHYRLRREDHIHYTSLVANATLDRWTTATFAVIPSTDTQELCVQISWETSEKTLSQCVSFELDGACVQQNAAILHDGLSRNASLLFVILLLFFKSAYCE